MANPNPQPHSSIEWEACTCGHSFMQHWHSTLGHQPGSISAMPSDDLGDLGACTNIACDCEGFVSAWKLEHPEPSPGPVLAFADIYSDPELTPSWWCP